VDERGLYRSDPLQEGGDDTEDVDHAHAHKQVFLDRAVRTRGDCARLEDLSQIVGHEGDVGRLERRLRAGDPHGYADICLRQGGGVVHVRKAVQLRVAKVGLGSASLAAVLMGLLRTPPIALGAITVPVANDSRAPLSTIADIRHRPRTRAGASGERWRPLRCRQRGPTNLAS